MTINVITDAGMIPFDNRADAERYLALRTSGPVSILLRDSAVEMVTPQDRIEPNLSYDWFYVDSLVYAEYLVGVAAQSGFNATICVLSHAGNRRGSGGPMDGAVAYTADNYRELTGDPLTLSDM